MIGYYLVTTLHVLVCLILILVVLLQSGKGADLAGAFGGGATQTAFGSRGPASFLSKVTTAAAVLFMITCLSLSLMGAKPEAKSILDNTKGQPVPVRSAPAQPDTPTPTPEQIKQMQQQYEQKQKQAPAGGQTPAQPAPQQQKQQPQK